MLLLLLACVPSDDVLDTAAPDDAPVAAFTWEAGCDLEPVIAFQSTSEPIQGELNQLLWAFGDGESGFGDLVIHRYADDGVFDVAHTAVDDAGRERSVRETVDVARCLEVTEREVNHIADTVSPVAVVANTGGPASAHVEFRLDLLDASGAAMVEDLPGPKAVVPPGSATVARLSEAWPCGADCDRITDVRVRLVSTFWYPVE